MFERYTQKARRVIFGAVYVARRVGSPMLETEHLLLGLLREDKSLARRFLGSPWAAETVLKKIEQIKPAQEKISGSFEVPLSSESKRALAFAAEEADLFSSKSICTQHVLLGLLREADCLAAKTLSEGGMDLASIREELRRARTMSRQLRAFLGKAAHCRRMLSSCRPVLGQLKPVSRKLSQPMTSRRLSRVQTKRLRSATSYTYCIENMDSRTGFLSSYRTRQVAVAEKW
jgi:ATP-dependent Clp protease ATP-binding subunit ClpA